MDLSSHSCTQHITQVLVPGSILLASFLGSLHCVGMCGGLILASTTDIKSNMTYHIGRLLGYLFLGYFSGTLGHTLQHFSWVSTVMGLSFIGIALLSLVKTPDFQIPILSKLVFKGLLSVRSKLSSSLYAFLVGLGSLFLPCGWLYTFVLAVSQTKSAWMGAAFMAMFWLGTLPALTLGAWLIKGSLKRWSKPISIIIYLIAGLTTLWFRS